MPGKLPIDRVRAAEDAPRIYAEEKQRFAQKQAKLRDGSQPPLHDATPTEAAAVREDAPEDTGEA